MQERPFHENHEEMFRWYDYWLKGIDTGIIEEPKIQIYVEGARRWRSESEWPLPQTKWTEFYLRPRHRLGRSPEPLPLEHAHPDGFYQTPFTVTNKSESVKWQSAEFQQDTEMTGPAALYLYMSIDTEDTNIIAKLYDVAPGGDRRQVSSGYLKASHREIDTAKSKPWQPHHPHTRAEPVPIGEVVEYAIRIYPFSYLFKPGHRLELEISCNESIDEGTAKLLPPDSYHLPSGRPTTHKFYRDRQHPSRLVLPVIPNA